ncbi:hypothetical protein H6P81_010106 [Aristolochia fimbriata]|uniref:Uncharacterized protein n=1 Tax=Aristolochia fimbriata TaxID=158543 RepID=A0AAV7EP09_ARIFI|nr:hypothetical protein H6P81_010106 [Aristolochia fimbriata]
MHALMFITSSSPSIMAPVKRPPPLPECSSSDIPEIGTEGVVDSSTAGEPPEIIPETQLQAFTVPRKRGRGPISSSCSSALLLHFPTTLKYSFLIVLVAFQGDCKFVNREPCLKFRRELRLSSDHYSRILASDTHLSC